eukprot:4303671-Prymnesium_polylepis.1
MPSVGSAEDSTAPLAILPLRPKFVTLRAVHSSLFDRHHAFYLLTASEAYFFQARAQPHPSPAPEPCTRALNRALPPSPNRS